MSESKLVLKKENDQLKIDVIKLKKHLYDAYRIIYEGKQKFTPNTTNSLVDIFLNNLEIKDFIKLVK